MSATPDSRRLRWPSPSRRDLQPLVMISLPHNEAHMLHVSRGNQLDSWGKEQFRPRAIARAVIIIIIWFVRLLALRPLLAYCASLG
jgi:hypothetical protein